MKIRKENPSSDYYWRKFNDLLAWALKFDKNSEEYETLIKVAWQMLDHFINLI